MRAFALLLFLNISFAEEKFVIGTIPSEGLFSSFLAVLSSLVWAEKNHKIPVVYWNESSCYAQSGGYNGSKNPWEYYFKPVSSLTYAPGDKTYAALWAPDGVSLYYAFCHHREDFFSKWRFIGKQAIDKYIRVKPSIMKKVNAFYNEKMAGKVTIGLHLRGTDKAGGKRDLDIRNLETQRWHEKAILRNEKQALAILEAGERRARESFGDVQFFIATDDESLLDLAKKTSMRPLIYCDSHRSLDGASLHRPAPNEKGGAVVGEEVLIETLLLAKCDFLAHSISSVPIAALIFNPELESEHVTVPYDPADFEHRRRGF